MAGFNLEPFSMTQESDCKVFTNEKPTKAPYKEKRPSSIVHFLHLNYMDAFTIII
jgi:hypothetical protein